MLEPLVRGHVIQHTADLLLRESDPTLALRVNSAISVEVRAALQELSPAAFYPRRFQVDLLSALAQAHGDGDATHRDLVRCGARIALANNDFMKLLTKLLTPELFAKKAERFWNRDHRHSGLCELCALDSSGGTARLRLRGVGGYTHAAVVWLGFMKTICEQMQPYGVQVSQQGWSWVEPAPDEVIYDLRWS